MTVTVRCKAWLTNIVQSLPSYARAFEEDYEVRLLDVRIASIIEDMLSPNLWATNSRAIDIHYSKVHEMMTKHQDVLHVLAKLA